MIVRVDDDIDTALESSSPEKLDLLDCCAMRVHDSFPLEEGASVEAGLSELLKERVVEVRGVDLHVGLLRRDLTEVEASVLLCPVHQVRQILAAQVVPVA